MPLIRIVYVKVDTNIIKDSALKLVLRQLKAVAAQEQDLESYACVLQIIILSMMGLIQHASVLQGTNYLKDCVSKHAQKIIMGVDARDQGRASSVSALLPPILSMMGHPPHASAPITIYFQGNHAFYKPVLKALLDVNAQYQVRMSNASALVIRTSSIMDLIQHASVLKAINYLEHHAC